MSFRYSRAPFLADAMRVSDAPSLQHVDRALRCS